MSSLIFSIFVFQGEPQHLKLVSSEYKKVKKKPFFFLCTFSTRFNFKNQAPLRFKCVHKNEKEPNGWKYRLSDQLFASAKASSIIPVCQCFFSQMFSSKTTLLSVLLQPTEAVSSNCPLQYMSLPLQTQQRREKKQKTKMFSSVAI